MNAEPPEQPARCLPQVWKVIGEIDHPDSWGSQSDERWGGGGEDGCLPPTPRLTLGRAYLVCASKTLKGRHGSHSGVIFPSRGDPTVSEDIFICHKYVQGSVLASSG